MIPSARLEDSIRRLLAADPLNLALADANLVHLIAAAFTPGRDTDFSALTVATFTGSTAKAAGTGTQQSFFDPVKGVQVVQVLEPAGGWHWQATADPAETETIFGWVLTDGDATFVLGSDLFPEPIPITATGDAVDIPEVRLNIPLGFMF